jgi:hypothetical protein
MIVFFSKIDQQKLQTVVDWIYDQINVNKIEEEALFNRTKFLTDELHRIKAYEDKILEELSKIAEEKDELWKLERGQQEKDVQSE